MGSSSWRPTRGRLQVVLGWLGTRCLESRVAAGRTGEVKLQIVGASALLRLTSLTEIRPDESARDCRATGENAFGQATGFLRAVPLGTLNLASLRSGLDRPNPARNSASLPLSVVGCTVFLMGGIADLAKATEVVGSVCADLDALRDCEFWKIPDDGLLSLAQLMERVGRLVYAAQVQLTGQIDTRGVAERFGCTSTGALLRQSLNISAGDAAARVRAARAVLPRDLPTGGEAPPVLPLLGAALAQGAVGVEQTRTVVGTMNQLPAKVDHDTRELAQQLLVRHARINEPTVFAAFARQVALRCDPDGKLDERDPVDKVELTLGARSPSTGLTGFRGFLDDLGVETLSQAIDGLARPRPAGDGAPDPRPAPVRRGQALIEALRRYLDTGQPPIQGGERPHVTVTMDRDALLGRLGAAVLEHGGPISAAQARMLACDALIIPAVLGSNSQVLDVGTANRVFTAAVRRAIGGFKRSSQRWGAKGPNSNCCIISAGVFIPRVFRGRAFSSAATSIRRPALWTDRSVPLGKYWRSSPLVFSLLPRCHGECGSQK